jgi:CRISPR-associated protein Csd1
LLRRWCDSDYGHPKARAVLRYVEAGTVVADLVREGILFCNGEKQLLTEWQADSSAPEIFRLLTPKAGKRDQGDAFVRWRVQVPHDPVTAVWEDSGLRQSWVKFDASENPDRGLCMVTGETTLLAKSHPKRLRHGADVAKLISSNDTSGFTFRGRFREGDEACGVGFEVTQKAHNALRWLISRQAYHDKSSGQAFVAWTVGGQPIPDPLKNTAQLFLDMPPEPEPEAQYKGDAGQRFALQLKKMIAGYSAKLGRTEEIVVMGLDSATPGRMAITFYRELSGSEFLERVLAWHQGCAWEQNFSKEVQFVGAPAPRDIAEAAYGRRLDDKLRKATVERILPCIVDGHPVPRDLVETCVRRACNRAGLKKWEWRKCLGIACALYKGLHKEESYQMSLEEERTSRDYLFGRLLALAEHLEQRALYVAGEKRDSNAEKLMQRFADRPSSTWRNIELALAPYKTRLRVQRPGTLRLLQEQLDAVTCKFRPGDFNDDKLSGEFLLGYHCQRAALWTKSGNDNGEAVEDELIREGE